MKNLIIDKTPAQFDRSTSGGYVGSAAGEVKMDERERVEKAVQRAEELMERTTEFRKAQSVPRAAYGSQRDYDEAEHGDDDEY